MLNVNLTDLMEKPGTADRLVVLVTSQEQTPILRWIEGLSRKEEPGEFVD